MRLEKYIEERWPRYFEFGGNPASGLVDVASTLHDTVATVTPAHAALLIADRDAILDAFVALATGAKTLDQIMGYA